MDAFAFEGCGIPLNQDMLVEADGVDEMAEHEESNMPGACPDCGAVQWDQM